MKRSTIKEMISIKRLIRNAEPEMALIKPIFNGMPIKSKTVENKVIQMGLSQDTKGYESILIKFTAIL